MPLYILCLSCCTYPVSSAYYSLLCLHSPLVMYVYTCTESSYVAICLVILPSMLLNLLPICPVLCLCTQPIYSYIIVSYAYFVSYDYSSAYLVSYSLLCTCSLLHLTCVSCFCNLVFYALLYTYVPSSVCVL